MQQQSANQMTRSKTIVFKKELPKMSQLTPKERMMQKKQQEIEAQTELMKQGAKDAKKNYNFANERKL